MAFAQTCTGCRCTYQRSALSPPPWYCSICVDQGRDAQDAELLQFGWAPGRYLCICGTCKNRFEGAKRSCRCRSCAEKTHRETMRLKKVAEEAMSDHNNDKLAWKAGDVVRCVDANNANGFIEEGGQYTITRMKADDDGDAWVFFRAPDGAESGGWSSSRFELVRSVSKEVDAKPDNVQHPAHYGGKDNPYEVIKVIEAWKLGFHLGTAVKYIPRAGVKDPTKEIEDLEKSIWYINRRIEQLKAGK